MKTKTSKIMNRPARPVPQRTCIACRTVKPKRELIRLVRDAGGTIDIDTTGKARGRGAYLCTDMDCWEKAIKGSILEHAFRSTIKQDNRDALLNRGKYLLREKFIGQNE